MDTETADELTVQQAARRVGRAAETVRRWIWSGRLPARKLGNVYYILAADLDAVSSGRQIPRQRQESGHRLTMAEWLDDVKRWKSTLNIAPTATAADLADEERDYQEERARRVIEHDWS